MDEVEKRIREFVDMTKKKGIQPSPEQMKEWERRQRRWRDASPGTTVPPIGETVFIATSQWNWIGTIACCTDKSITLEYARYAFPPSRPEWGEDTDDGIAIICNEWIKPYTNEHREVTIYRAYIISVERIVGLIGFVNERFD